MRALFFFSLAFGLTCSVINTFVIGIGEDNIFSWKIFFINVFVLAFFWFLSFYVTTYYKLKSLGIQPTLSNMESHHQIEVTSNIAPSKLIHTIKNHIRFKTRYIEEKDNYIHLFTSKSGNSKQFTSIHCTGDQPPYHYSIESKPTTKWPFFDYGENIINVHTIKSILEEQNT